MSVPVARMKLPVMRQALHQITSYTLLKIPQNQLMPLALFFYCLSLEYLVKFLCYLIIRDLSQRMDIDMYSWKSVHIDNPIYLLGSLRIFTTSQGPRV